MKRSNVISIGVLALLNVLLLGGIFHTIASDPASPPTTAKAREMENILRADDLQAQTEAYRALLERVGVEQGQALLYRSSLPFNGETHLLNHTAGNVAYEKYGNAAISYCYDYFLGSCYHGAILNTIAAEGTAGLRDTMEQCREAGGGPLAAQCAHGIGHGVLAWSGYKKLPRALEMCDDLAESDSRFPLFNCHDGVFMENLWAVHSGEKSDDQWIKKGDFYYPCSDPRIKDAWKGGCWSNQPANVFQQTNSFKKVFDVCQTVNNEDLRSVCLDGLARQIHPYTDGNASKVFGLCRQAAGASDWYPQCVYSIVRAEFSVGGRTLPYHLCEQIDERYQSGCYEALVAIIHSYAQDAQQEQQWCASISSEKFRSQCTSSIK